MSRICILVSPVPPLCKRGGTRLAKIRQYGSKSCLNLKTSRNFAYLKISIMYTFPKYGMAMPVKRNRLLRVKQILFDKNEELTDDAKV